MIIADKCVVRIDLDTNQLSKLREQYGDETFYTGADDNAYYSTLANSIIKANNTQLRTNNNELFVKFISQGKSIKVIKIDSLPQQSNFYFFEPGKLPYAPDITPFSSEYQSFFK